MTSINETRFFEEKVVLKFIFVEHDIVVIVGLLVIGGFVYFAGKAGGGD